jgi:predicted PurR-regulated permease PerM
MVHPRARADFWNVWSIINAVLSNYVRGQLILGFAVGTAVGIGLLSLQLIGIDMQYILLLSILAGITELIPILGPIIGAVPAVLIGFSISPTAGVAVLILYILIQQLENNFLVPRIVGESIGIHPAVLSVLLIALGQVFGLSGIILSAPAAAIARDLFVYTYQRLSGSNPAVARNDVHERAIGEAPADP